MTTIKLLVKFLLYGEKFENCINLKKNRINVLKPTKNEHVTNRKHNQECQLILTRRIYESAMIIKESIDVNKH